MNILHQQGAHSGARTSHADGGYKYLMFFCLFVSQSFSNGQVCGRGINIQSREFRNRFACLTSCFSVLNVYILLYIKQLRSDAPTCKLQSNSIPLMNTFESQLSILILSLKIYSNFTYQNEKQINTRSKMFYQT